MQAPTLSPQEVKQPRLATSMEIPDKYSWADIYVFGIAFILFPGVVVVFVLNLVVSLIPKLLMAVRRSYLQRPQKIVPRSYVFDSVLLIFALPMMILALLWVLIVHVVNFTLSFPIGVLYWSRTTQSFEALRPFNGRLGDAGEVYTPTDRLVAQYSNVWDYRDVVANFIGAIDRQGFGEFFLATSLLVSLVPVVKIVMMANPRLYKLAPMFVNQWTRPIDADNDRKLTRKDQEKVADSLKEQIVHHLLEEPKRAMVDEFPFIGHYAHPPEGRESKTMIGTQFDVGMVFVHTVHTHLKEDFVPRSKDASIGIVSVYLQAWNPWHHLTGYVEINVRKDGGAEHPMWLIADKSSKWQMIRLESVNKLFVELGDCLTKYVQKFKSK
eukprot:jgi/Bigna1/66046/fgenesh1_pg.1_\